MKTNHKALHVTINLVVNENSSWSYESPKVEKHFEMHIPVDLFAGRATGEKIAEYVETMVSLFPSAVVEHEAEKAREKAEEEAEKARAETES